MSIFKDIAKDVLNRNNINLEHVASGALGEAIIELDDIFRTGGSSRRSSGLLTAEQLNNGNYDGSANNVNSSVYYAQDYDRYAPKSKFLFKVWFQFNEAYEGLLPTLEGQGSFRGFSYVIKTIDKPKVNYEYEEVNMYNHRTKVLKTVKHEPISMSLHDDISNSVMDFFNLYRTAFSPVSRLTGSQSMNVENDGMSFGSPVQSAISCNLIKKSKNFLKSIVVAQIYAGGVKANFYEFVNPRIETFDFDNMDMESSLPHGVTVSFSYDGLYFRDVNLYQETVDNWIVNKVPFGIWGSTDVNSSTPTSLGMGITNSASSQPGSSKGDFSQNSNPGAEGGPAYNSTNGSLGAGLTGLRSVDGLINTVIGSYGSILDQSVGRAIHGALGKSDRILGPIADVYRGRATSAIKDAIGSFF